ncbi:MAG: hypothetical protein JNL21_27680 [Myxococcales bacterium]|nr:hypothetical protein [Myxococcales bacterium]
MSDPTIASNTTAQQAEDLTATAYRELIDALQCIDDAEDVENIPEHTQHCLGSARRSIVEAMMFVRLQELKR